MVKKVVGTVGKFKDYGDEIQQRYVLGFTPYRLHKNVDGSLPPFVFIMGRLDDVSTMEVRERYLTMDTITGIFCKGWWE